MKSALVFVLLEFVLVACCLQFGHATSRLSWRRKPTLSLANVGHAMVNPIFSVAGGSNENHNLPKVVDSKGNLDSGHVDSPVPGGQRQKWTYLQLFSWNFVGTFFGGLLRKVITDEDILNITTKSISAVIWFAIIVGALGTAGFDTKPILSIFGVAGITLGLSLQNLFTDLYAGLFVLFTRPFKRGSVINVSGFTGRVVSIDMRYVQLRNDQERSDVMLPISLVYRNAVKILDHPGKK